MGKINLREAFAAGWRVYAGKLGVLVRGQAIVLAIWFSLAAAPAALALILVSSGKGADKAMDRLASISVVASLVVALLAALFILTPLAAGTALLARDCFDARPAKLRTVFRGYSMWRERPIAMLIMSSAALLVSLLAPGIWVDDLGVAAGLAGAFLFLFSLVAEGEKPGEALRKTWRTVKANVRSFILLALAMTIIINWLRYAVAAVFFLLPVGITQMMIPLVSYGGHLIWMTFALPFSLCVTWAAYRQVFPAPLPATPLPTAPDWAPPSMPDVRRPAGKRRRRLALAVAASACVIAVAVEFWPRSARQMTADSPTIGYKFVAIPPGRFQMGSPGDEPGRFPDQTIDETQHWVTISKPFLIGATKVTQGQWRALMGNNPSEAKDCGDECPVENVNWADAIAFCNKLSDREGLSRCYKDAGWVGRAQKLWNCYSDGLKQCRQAGGTTVGFWKNGGCVEDIGGRFGDALVEDTMTWNRDCTGYRLPTEAEWEYAARAGTATAFANGPITAAEYYDCEADSHLDEIGWYRKNSNGKVHPVGQKQPNGWGVYDAQGDVLEWVWDRYDDYPSGDVTDPAGPSSGSRRVGRGCAWRYCAKDCRSASRVGFFSRNGLGILGFRLAGSLSAKSPLTPAASLRKRDGAGGQPSTTARPASPPPTTSDIGYQMIVVPSGGFAMGSPESECDRNENRETLHRVTITKDFLLGATDVTQAQWQKVMGNNPSYFKHCGDDCPVENVSWFDAVEFCNRLSDAEGLPRCYSGTSNAVQWNRACTGYRLPTEAEWEYAARAGTTTPFNTGQCLSADDANYRGSSPGDYCPEGVNRRRTVHVGSFAPNAWGLYDMHGNVWQWVWDRRGYYPSNPVADPTGPKEGARRIIRGGSWFWGAEDCRSAKRFDALPDRGNNALGFRVARTAP
jgi:formylglycine-generating enzyme required for sulfatase activity